MRSNSERRFADAWGGINYQFKKDDATPALLGFAELALREKHSQSSHSFKSFLFGLTTYRAIDPVVLSLTGAYRHNQSRTNGTEGNYQPGNLMLLNPSVAFAANDRITLSTGFQWLNRWADRINGNPQGQRKVSTDLQIGVGYGIAKGNTANLIFNTNASGSNGTGLRLSWAYTF